MRKDFEDDPFAKALVPPADETPTEATARLRAEKEARDRNDEINKELERGRKSLDKQKKDVLKMLILGQSGSGTSPLCATKLLLTKVIHLTGKSTVLKSE